MRGKKPILLCKCKMCDSTYLDSLPVDRTDIDAEHIARWANTIASTHDCSKGDTPIENAFGVGEVLGVIYR